MVNNITKPMTNVAALNFNCLLCLMFCCFSLQAFAKAPYDMCENLFQVKRLSKNSLDVLENQTKLDSVERYIDEYLSLEYEGVDVHSVSRKKADQAMDLVNSIEGLPNASQKYKVSAQRAHKYAQAIESQLGVKTFKVVILDFDVRTGRADVVYSAVALKSDGIDPHFTKKAMILDPTISRELLNIDVWYKEITEIHEAGEIFFVDSRNYGNLKGFEATKDISERVFIPLHNQHSDKVLAKHNAIEKQEKEKPAEDLNDFIKKHDRTSVRYDEADIQKSRVSLWGDLHNRGFEVPKTKKRTPINKVTKIEELIIKWHPSIIKDQEAYYEVKFSERDEPFILRKDHPNINAIKVMLENAKRYKSTVMVGVDLKDSRFVNAYDQKGNIPAGKEP